MEGTRPQGGVPGGEVPADSQRRRGTATDANVLQSTWRALGRSETRQPVQAPQVPERRSCGWLGVLRC